MKTKMNVCTERYISITDRNYMMHMACNVGKTNHMETEKKLAQIYTIIKSL